MKTIFKSMSCLMLGAMIVMPMFAQQKIFIRSWKDRDLLLLSQKIKWQGGINQCI